MEENLEKIKREDNPFEDEAISKEWISSVENERGMIREKELYPMIVKWIEKIKPKRIIDIGAGQGGCANIVQLEGVEYVGVEPSKYLVARAEEINKKENRHFIIGTAYNLPIPDKSFDAAFSVNVWFHLQDLNTASKELARVLLPNGKFFICTANPDAYGVWQQMFDSDAKVDEKIIDGKVNIPVNPLSRNLFFKHSMEETLDAFTNNGLIVDKTETSGVLNEQKPLFINFFGHAS